MYVDVKVSVWKRIELPESASKEELIKMLKLGDEGIYDLFDIYDNLEYNEVENSEEILTPEDNGGQETIELYDPDIKDDGPVWTNKPEYPSIIKIEWGVDDFESRASENEEYADDMKEGNRVEGEATELIYDRTKFPEALNIMDQNHDCNIGITWDTIDEYLDEYCKL